MGADVPDLFLGPSRLGRADLTCSLRMILVMEGTRKEKKGLEYLFIFLKSLVDFLKLLVATVYVDFTACAPCKRLCLEYTTFAPKTTYCVLIVHILRVSDLLRTYTTCMYDVRLVHVSNLLRTYRTAFARKKLMRLKRLVRTWYNFCA